MSFDIEEMYYVTVGAAKFCKSVIMVKLCDSFLCVKVVLKVGLCLSHKKR